MFRRTRPRPVLIDTFQMTFDGRTLPITLRVSLRSRYVRLEFRSGGLFVTIPRTYPRQNVPQFLEEKRRWILKMLAHYGSVEPDVFSRALQYGDAIPYMGEHLTLRQLPGANGTATAALQDDSLLINTGKRSLQEVVEAWYKQQARQLIGQRVAELSRDLGITCGRVSVRKARTRWGSCSRKRDLSFNWKLMTAPPTVIDYVIIHELSHIREMNHSRRFWDLVMAACPDWRECRQWLREHEPGTDRTPVL